MYGRPHTNGSPATASRVTYVQLTDKLREQVAAIADRDGNGLSATLRRLIAAGIRSEDHDEEEIVEVAMQHLAQAETELYWFTRLSSELQKTPVPDDDECDVIKRQQEAAK